MNSVRVIALRLGCAFGIILTIFSSYAVCQTQQPRPVQYTLGSQLIFWVGGLSIMVLMGRIIFKEQLNERRTLSRLIKEIGPFYPEFDIDHIKTWVHLCAPHVWQGFVHGDLSKIDHFVTERFKQDMAEHVERVHEQGQTLECEFVGVLKVHPLGLYMVGQGPAPRDVELMLRLEQKALYHLVDAGGKTLKGRSRMDQVQHFWTLVHDGDSYRVDRVWLAERDATDLAERELPPDVRQWTRPEVANKADPGPDSTKRS
ncbi:MAG: hypothetical protein CMH52_02375 [Myxococcales bacterium]|nr:hypothetical protein [Myxococcales bacterium]|tara:strand:+ start:246 stop:1019 length:774 start_codon:yes stop_codon:yes gene_type:complete